MGKRYIIEVICPGCNFVDNNVYYAPTCGFTKWKCPKCKQRVNLEKYTGISTKEASNKKIISKHIKDCLYQETKKE